MKKILIIIIICTLSVLLLLTLFLLLFFVLKNNNSIIGKWKSIDSKYEYYYIFNKDNTCSYKIIGARLNCTYKIDDNTIIINYKGNDKPKKYKYNFDKNILVIEDEHLTKYKFIKEK